MKNFWDDLYVTQSLLEFQKMIDNKAYYWHWGDQKWTQKSTNVIEGSKATKKTFEITLEHYGNTGLKTQYDKWKFYKDILK